MYLPKPKCLLGQAMLAFCLLIALVAFYPGSAKGDAEPNAVGAVSGEKTVLASVKIDTTSMLLGEIAQIPILIRNDSEIGQFRLIVDFNTQHMTFLSAELGEILSDGGWEDLDYRVEIVDETTYRIVLVGTYDVPDSHQGVPLAVNYDYVELVTLHFLIDVNWFPDGAFLPVVFEWDASDCLENTLQDPSFDTLYVSQDSLQFNSFYCPSESLAFLAVLPSLEFDDGGLFVFSPLVTERGDINLNHLPYEVADWMLFGTFLLEGDSILFDPQTQTANADVNWDQYSWSTADLIHLGRVILHDVPAVLEPTSLSEYDMNTWMTTIHSLPNDTVVLPVWYDGQGSETVYGISFKVDFDPEKLTFLGMDFSGTSLENWEYVFTLSEDSSVRLNAIPDMFSMSEWDSLAFSFVPHQIAKLLFEIAAVDTPTFISVTFGEDTSPFIQANSFATKDGNLTKLGISDVTDGGVQLGGALECERGDLNLNHLSYEVADWVLFGSFLFYGPGFFVFDPLYQLCATDANNDSTYGTIADLLYMWRVIFGDAVPFPSKDQGDILPEPSGDEYIAVPSSANPSESVSVPIWFTNSLPSRGNTFRLEFDEDLLSVEGVDVSGSRIPGWEYIWSVFNPGELFVISFADWQDDLNDILIEPGKGLLINVNFKVNENAPSGTFLPITFETKEDWGHYNSYTDSTGLILVQPPTVSGWIFTDVISGDANSDGAVDLSDIIYLLNYLFKDGIDPSPLSLGDLNEDGQVNISDVIALLNQLYKS